MANSRPTDGVTPEELVAYFEANGLSSEAWELVRHRIVTDYAFKVGEHPGVVLFLQADSEDEARTIVDSMPIVTQGLLRFEVDPLREVMHLSLGS
jgi:hypothetical protein